MPPSESKATFSLSARDLPAAAALMRRELGASFVDDGYLDWWYFANPSGLRSFRGSLNNGVLAALATMNGFDFLLGACPRKVGMPQNVAVEERLRGRGLFGTLYRDCEAEMRAAGCDCFLTFTNAASTPIFLAKFGYRRGIVPDLLVLPANPLDLFGVSGCRRVATFDEGLLSKSIRLVPNAVIKSVRYFKWRYTAHGTEQFRILEMESAPEGPKGYAILKFVRKRGLPLALLLDLALPEGFSHRVALTQARAYATRSGKAALLLFDAAGVGDAARTLLHWPIRNRFNFLVKGRDLEETERLASSRFSFSLGDLDFI